MLKNPVEENSVPNGYLHNFRVKNFYSLHEIGMENLGSSKEVYLLGENGDGKTLILMSLVLAFNGGFIEAGIPFKEIGTILDMTRKNPSASFQGKDINGRIFNYPRFNRPEDFQIFPFDNLLAYGVHRSRSDSEKASKYGFLTLFDSDQYLISPERWLMSLYTKDLERRALKSTSTGSSISLETAKKILTDLVEKNVEIEVDSNGVRYIERGTHLQFYQLSEGYKSVITWVCDMVARLSETQPEVQALQDLKGVVLVDEINLHLHPRWEKEIVKKLRTWFPKVQFFFTTHSPVSILGASDDAVFYRVYKENGVTSISEPFYKKDMKDLMANTVLTSPLFGLEDARMEGEGLSKRNLDTSDDYLYSRIHQKISERLEQQKREGKAAVFSESEIDSMIDLALNEELA